MTDNLNTMANILRNRSTVPESLLWKHLRSKKLEGLKFRRQAPIGNYIVDFVCFEKRIVIEVDGGQHSMQTGKLRDIKKDAWLREQGFKVLRFWNNEVLGNLNGVLEAIRERCLSHPPLTPPIKGGENFF